MANLRSSVALIVTVFVIIAAAALITFMILDVDAADETWKRYAYVLTGVESIVFAAVGWLFGKEIHREQAERGKQAGRSRTGSQAGHGTSGGGG